MRLALNYKGHKKLFWLKQSLRERKRRKYSFEHKRCSTQKEKLEKKNIMLLSFTLKLLGSDFCVD